MSLAPLLDAPLIIRLHAFAAMAAFVLGLVQFAGIKGSRAHRIMGWIWVILMLTVAISSFWINQIRLLGPFSPIHLLSIMAPVFLILGVYYARRHQRRSHARTMIGVFLGALVIAGIFTFAPGRIMYAMMFGN